MRLVMDPDGFLFFLKLRISEMFFSELKFLSFGEF